MNANTSGFRERWKWLVRAFFGVLLIAALLFIPAGRLDWVWGWVYIGVYSLASVVAMFIADLELLPERGKPKKDTKSWDKVLFGIYGTLTGFVTPVVAALDVRLGWSRQIPLALQVGALVVCGLGWAVHLWAMASNKFFSNYVRIQKERGHVAVTDGPYRIVRHPGYVGGLAINLATPLVLGSLWAFILGGIGALLLIVRTALEDKTLQAELAGYKEYAQQVRYRLLPGIW